jgi:hypothetical protein
MSLHLFACGSSRPRAWYERLLGEPTFLAHATEAVWTLAEDRSVFVVEHADRAGNSVVTIFVDALAVSSGSTPRGPARCGARAMS